MGAADKSSGENHAAEEWINEYKIQSQEYSRLVTVPQAVDIDIEETVWVWRCRDEDNQHTEYLRLSTTRPTEAPASPGETFLGTRSVMAHGERGKSVTIPNECDEERFACESKVGISCGRDENDGVLYLKLIPESVYSSAISGVLDA